MFLLFVTDFHLVPLIFYIIILSTNNDNFLSNLHGSFLVSCFTAFYTSRTMLNNSNEIIVMKTSPCFAPKVNASSVSLLSMM